MEGVCLPSWVSCWYYPQLTTPERLWWITFLLLVKTFGPAFGPLSRNKCKCSTCWLLHACSCWWKSTNRQQNKHQQETRRQSYHHHGIHRINPLMGVENYKPLPPTCHPGYHIHWYGAPTQGHHCQWHQPNHTKDHLPTQKQASQHTDDGAWQQNIYPTHHIEW